MKEKALALSKAGLAIIPVHGKRAFLKGWQNLATTDEEQISKWWDENPGANIAIVTGREKNVIVVVDVDNHNGVDGEISLQALEGELGTLPKNRWEAESGSGGRHLYFACYQDLPNVTGLAPGVDVKATNGYVVAPPSVHPDTSRAYKWAEGKSPFDTNNLDVLPEEWIKAIQHHRHKGKQILERSEGADIPEGERNDALFNYGRQLREAGVKANELRKMLLDYNKQKCMPTLEENEVLRIYDSVMTRGTKPGKKTAITIVPKKISELDDSPIEWLIPGWIPRTGITLLAGDGGTGKGLIWTSLVSDLSKGDGCFLRYEKDAEPKRCLVISAEDPENILRQRFEKAGGSENHISIVGLDTIQYDSIEAEVEGLTFDRPEMEDLIKQTKPDLVICDPLQSFLSRQTDMSSRNAMRHALTRVMNLSSRHQCAFVVIAHTNKRNETGRLKIADSADLWDISRSVLMTGKCEKGRYISLEKGNYCDIATVPTIIFSIENGVVNVLETTDKKMADFVQDQKGWNPGASESTSLKQECCNAILGLLSENDGTLEATKMDETLRETFSLATIKRAKHELVNAKFIRMNRQKGGSVVYTRN